MNIFFSVFTAFLFITTFSFATNVDSLNNLAIKAADDSEVFVDSDWDSCMYYTKLAAKYYKAAGNDRGYVNSLNGVSGIYYYTNRYVQFEENAKGVYDYALVNLEAVDPVLGSTINNLSAYYADMGLVHKALEMRKEALVILQSSEDTLSIANAMHNIGNLYSKQKEYLLALDYYTSALEFRRRMDNPIPYQIARNHFAIGKTLKGNKEYAKSIAAYKKAVGMFSGVSENERTSRRIHNFLFRSYISLSENYLEFNDFKKAKLYAQKCKSIDYDERESYRYSLLFSEISKKEGHLLQAKKHIVEAVSLWKTTHSEDVHPTLSQLYYKLVKLEEGSNKLDCAIKALHALGINLNQENQTIIFSDQVVYDPVLIEVAITILKLLLDEYQHENKSIALTTAWIISKRIISVFPILSEHLIIKESKNSNNKDIQAFLNLAVECAYLVQNEFEDSDIQAISSFFTDYNKSKDLSQNLAYSYEFSQNKIPEEYIKDRDQLLREIILLENKIFVAIDKDIKASLKKVLARRRVSLRDVEEKNKGYIDLAPKMELPFYTDVIRNKVKTNVLFLEYFKSETAYYVNQISLGKSRLHFLGENHEIDNLVNKILHAQRYDQNEVKLNSYTRDLKNLKSLLIPGQINLNLFNYIVVVQDGRLNQIAFDNFLVVDKNLGKDINLIHALSIREFFNERIKENVWDYEFVSLAPKFVSGNKFNLSELICNEKEINQISKNFDSASTVNLTNKNDLLDLPISSRYLHLSTHASSSDDLNSQNKIYFTDEVASAKELELMKLNVDLTILNTCDSGSGYFYEGNGVMSLSKSFIEQGSQSVIASLWQVDDCISTKFMDALYKNRYFESSQYLKALANTKLAFSEQSIGDLSKPFYWSNYIYYGNSKDIAAFEEKERFVLIPSFVVFLLGLFLLNVLFKLK